MYFPQLKDSIPQPNDKNTWEKKLEDTSHQIYQISFFYFNC